MLVVDGLSESRFQLFGDVEIVKDGNGSLIKFDNILFFWGDNLQIVLDLIEDLGVVDVNAVIGGIEKVTEQGHRSAFLLKAEFWTLCRLLYFRDGVFPTFQKHFQLTVEFCCALSFCHRADNDAEILRLDTLNQLLQSAAFLSALDLRRDGYTVVEGY